MDLGQYTSTSKACVSRRSPIFSKLQNNSGAHFWTWSITALPGQQIHQSFRQCLHNRQDTSEHTAPKLCRMAGGSDTPPNPSLRPKQPHVFQDDGLLCCLPLFHTCLGELTGDRTDDCNQVSPHGHRGTDVSKTLAADIRLLLL